MVVFLYKLIVYLKSIIEEIKTWEVSSHQRLQFASLRIYLVEDTKNLDPLTNTCPATLNMEVTTNYSNADKYHESTAVNLCTSLVNVFGGSYELSNNGFCCNFQLPCRSQTDKSFTDDVDFYRGDGDAQDMLAEIDDSTMKAMLGLKIGVVTCPNGFETCITNLLDKSFDFTHKYSVLSQSSRETFETFNSFDIVFTEDLKLCQKLKTHHLRGEIVFFHAKLAYMNQDDYDSVCDR